MRSTQPEAMRRSASWTAVLPAMIKWRRPWRMISYIAAMLTRTWPKPPEAMKSPSCTKRPTASATDIRFSRRSRVCSPAPIAGFRPGRANRPVARGPLAGYPYIISQSSGSRILEAGNWKLETGSWTSGAMNRHGCSGSLSVTGIRLPASSIQHLASSFQPHQYRLSPIPPTPTGVPPSIGGKSQAHYLACLQWQRDLDRLPAGRPGGAAPHLPAVYPHPDTPGGRQLLRHLGRR